jgi:hypothetical protein
MTTCSQCAHYRKSPIHDGMGLCSELDSHVPHDYVFADSCTGFALAGWSIEWRVSGLYWVPDFVEDRSGNVILLNWQLRRETSVNQCGFERLGKLRRKPREWHALRYGQPIHEGTLTECARALVERVRR